MNISVSNFEHAIQYIIVSHIFTVLFLVCVHDDFTDIPQLKGRYVKVWDWFACHYSEAYEGT